MTARIKRRGQSLVEFALVALVTYMLLAAILTFGQLFFTAQVVQSAANTLAREISVAEIPNNYESIDDFIYGDSQASVDFRERVFDPTLLIVPIDEDGDATSAYQAVENGPMVNKMLSVVMVNNGTAFQFPGVMPNDNGRYVLVHQLNELGEPSFVPVIEDFSSNQLDFDETDLANSGVVAARINYPFHSVSMSAMEKPEVFGDSNMGNVIEANPAEFTEASPEVLDPRKEIYGGEHGLGRQYAWGKQVRPYRHILSGQAVYHREVFMPAETAVTSVETPTTP